MRCPFCGHEDTQVVDTRSSPEASAIRRRRKCPECDKRFTTYERIDLKLPRLVKKDGSRAEFDREKLVGSMKIALRKRPVATEALDAAVQKIEDRLRTMGEREVPTSKVGDLVIEVGLRRARRGKRDIPLSAREEAFLSYLAQRQGEVVSRAELLAHVWDDDKASYSNIVDVYASRLRRKIDDRGESSMLRTLRGSGYMIEAPAARAGRSGR